MIVIHVRIPSFYVDLYVKIPLTPHVVIDSDSGLLQHDFLENLPPSPSISDTLPLPITGNALDTSRRDDPELESLRRSYETVSAQNEELRTENEGLREKLKDHRAGIMVKWRDQYNNEVKRIALIKEEFGLLPMARVNPGLFNVPEYVVQVCGS